jgi:hypothetical protein
LSVLGSSTSSSVVAGTGECTPKTYAEACGSPVYTCDSVDDNCGGSINCACDPWNTCSDGGPDQGPWSQGLCISCPPDGGYVCWSPCDGGNCEPQCALGYICTFPPCGNPESSTCSYVLAP